MSNIVVYSCITGDYEQSKTGQNWGDADWFMFTDKELPESPDKTGWKYLPARTLFKDPRRDARWHKLLSHQLFPNYDYTIWIDGSIVLKITPEELVAKMGEADLMTFKHPNRTTVTEEAEECIRLKLDEEWVIKEYISRIGSSEFNLPLAETKVVVRRNSAEVELFNQEWFYQLMSGTLRDQISFPYVAGLVSLNVKYMDAISKGNPDFGVIGHIRDKRYG